MDSELDLANLIEEIESLGRSEKRGLESRLTALLLHLLKWQHQPVRRSRSWELSIDEQRVKFLRVLKDNPDLKSQLDEVLANAYEISVIKAAKETSLDKKTFPSACPWDLPTITKTDFYPED
ncbi:DUF29 domain-containing protein [Methylovulum psychrotolerans]|uniref:DUF29 domain-containing protein n=1 Tax=Methylovulum psychrotolerans TaxID=1704499 RepID=A0A2S5CR62_9GAMM|nr:DUF29 domain-containing protein [Methylovulum psychrotolerans]POZ53294.1 hypothetical protein AADEFJLK_00313 [Methylovulum psychrotolerans]